MSTSQHSENLPGATRRVDPCYGAVTSSSVDAQTTSVSGENSEWSLWLWPLHGLQWYLAVLGSMPLRTKVITSTILSALSDIIAQSVEFSLGEGGAYDWRRVTALALVGCLLTGPGFHMFYEYLEVCLPLVGGIVGGRNLVLQVLVDQLAAMPVWLVGFFAVVQAVEIGKIDIEEIWLVMRRDFFPSLKLTWAVFPVCQLLSFGLLPCSMRVLVLNFVDIGYTAGLSYIKHK